VSEPLRILLVEDDPTISDLVREGFADEPMTLELAADGPTGLERASSAPFDVVLLDIELPGYDGLELLRRLRASGSDVPVIILTGRGDEADIVRGLSAGADDYVAKPFSGLELVARIQAVHRRAMMASGRALRFGDVELDVVRGRATRAGHRIPLTPTEFELLRVLMTTPGVPVSRQDLLARVWDITFDPGTNLVDVHISRLRSKLEADGAPRIVHSVRGEGFRVACE